MKHYNNASLMKITFRFMMPERRGLRNAALFRYKTFDKIILMRFDSVLFSAFEREISFS